MMVLAAGDSKGTPPTDGDDEKEQEDNDLDNKYRVIVIETCDMQLQHVCLLIKKQNGFSSYC